MSFHIGGGVGPSGGTQLGIMTQGIGYPLREVSETSVVTFGVKATDDAGDGTVEGDMNATDFTSQLGTTYVEVLPQYIMTVVHKEISYLYQGPRNVRIGVGGDYTSLNEDYSALGTADHNLLVNREIDDQHPISAITNLTGYLEDFTVSGYGGIVLGAPAAFPDIGLGWQTLPATEGSVTTPRYVTQDFATNSLSLASPSVWEVSIALAFSQVEAQAGRETYIRLLNQTAGTPGRSILIGIARNQPATNFSVTALFDVANAGDQIVVQIGGGDAITGVTIENYSFTAKNLAPLTSAAT